MIKVQAALLVMALAFMGCSGSNSIGKRIDFMAGHPGDPKLPESALGATDLVLEASDPVELRDLLYDGLRYARRKARRKPRYLFALGRVAQVLEYDDLADSCFTVAAKNGSAAAHAYLGFREFYENEDIEAAVSRFETAIAEGFVDPELEKAYEACNFDPETYGFNRPDIFSALYTKDWNKLDSLSNIKRRLGAIQEGMWGYDILWITEDYNLLLEQNAFFQREINLFPLASRTNLEYRKTFYAPEFQDAQRLAILYKENPVAFRRIYVGIVEYCQHAGWIEKRDYG